MDQRQRFRRSAKGSRRQPTIWSSDFTDGCYRELSITASDHNRYSAHHAGTGSHDRLPDREQRPGGRRASAHRQRAVIGGHHAANRECGGRPRGRQYSALHEFRPADSDTLGIFSIGRSGANERRSSSRCGGSGERHPGGWIPFPCAGSDKLNGLVLGNDNGLDPFDGEPNHWRFLTWGISHLGQRREQRGAHWRLAFDVSLFPSRIRSPSCSFVACRNGGSVSEHRHCSQGIR